MSVDTPLHHMIRGVNTPQKTPHPIREDLNLGLAQTALPEGEEWRHTVLAVVEKRDPACIHVS